MKANRRMPRMVSDTKIRQVGFITPGEGKVRGEDQMSTSKILDRATSAASSSSSSSLAPASLPSMPSRAICVPLVGSSDTALPTSLWASSSLPANFAMTTTSSNSKQCIGGEKKSKPLKKKTTKAERRALQEAQRVAKEAAKETVKKAPGFKNKVECRVGASSKDPNALKSSMSRKDSNIDKNGVARLQFDGEHVSKAKKRSILEQTETRSRVELFKHLLQFVPGSQLPILEAKFFQDDHTHPLHPSVFKVGLQFLNGDIVGGNARCIAMLSALQDAIHDHNTPPKKGFIRYMTARINSYISFLVTCRPLSISMGNAIKFLKARIAKLKMELTETEAKNSLISDINRFGHEKIILADKVIVNHAVSKIRDGDVLLTYGLPFVVVTILLHAHELQRQFQVVVVDSRPRLEGVAMLKKLLEGGLTCTYTHINAVSFVMKSATKVLIGAASVLSNGTVYSRVGTACVAMVAHAFHVPVLVCCEGYKFHERVQLDSICSNELGDPNVLTEVPGRPDINSLEGWMGNERLQLLNLMYDATPTDYVSMLVTDYGMVPPTSVSVIVREYRKEYLLV